MGEIKKKKKKKENWDCLVLVCWVICPSVHASERAIIMSEKH